MKYRCNSIGSDSQLEFWMNELTKQGYSFLAVATTANDSNGPLGIVIMEKVNEEKQPIDGKAKAEMA